MNGLKIFVRYYKFFSSYIGQRIILLGCLSLLTTLTEGAGIALFFSYLQSLAGSTIVPKVIIKLNQVLTYLGIPTSPLAVIGSLIVVFIVRGFLILLQNSYQYNIYTSLTKRLTGHVIDTLSGMRYLDYLKRNTGYFTHLVTAEINNAVTVFYQVCALIPKSVSILTYLILSLQFQWRFTAFAVLFGVLISLIYKGVNDLTKRHAHELSIYESTQASLMIQFLHAFKYLFATENTQVLREKVKANTAQIARLGSRIGVLSAIIPASSEPLIVIFISGCVYYQSKVLGGDLSMLMVAIMFLYRVIRELTVVQSSWQTLNRYAPGVERIMECFSDLARFQIPSGSIELHSIDSGISLEKVSFSYGEKNILKEASFNIPAKSMVAFVGESGSGKSTLVDLITGVLTPTQGELKINGLDYKKIKLQTLHRKTGYVTQESVMFDDTVANNVSLWQLEKNPTQNVEEDVWQALRDAQCESFVKQLPHGIHQKLGDRGVRLSGGQRQRIAIARELFRKPELIVLDEATSALDSESEAAIQKSIDAMKGKATVIVIAHRLSTVRNCDQIFVLDNGSVVEQGNFSELMNSGKVFKRMCEIQSLQ